MLERQPRQNQRTLISQVICKLDTTVILFHTQLTQCHIDSFKLASVIVKVRFTYNSIVHRHSYEKKLKVVFKTIKLGLVLILTIFNMGAYLSYKKIFH